MVDVYKPPYGTYTSVQIIVAAAQTEQMANIQSLATLLGGTITAGVVASTTGYAGHPDFNKIDHATRMKILTELAAISAAIDAAPIA